MCLLPFWEKLDGGGSCGIKCLSTLNQVEIKFYDFKPGFSMVLLKFLEENGDWRVWISKKTNKNVYGLFCM